MFAKLLTERKPHLNYIVCGIICDFFFVAYGKGLYLNLIAPAFSPVYTCAEAQAYRIFKWTEKIVYATGKYGIESVGAEPE